MVLAIMTPTQGWKCPSCGRNWAPHVDSCRTCEPGAAPAAAQAITVAQLWELFEPWGLRHIGSWKPIHATHKQHLLAHFGALPWTGVVHARADEYVTKRLAERTLRGNRPVKAGTVNRELATLKAMINWGLGKRAGGPPPGQCALVGSNPLEKYPALPESTERDWHLPEDQCVKFLESCRPMLQMMVIFALETGMRRDEFRLLEWDEIHPERRIVHLAASRTKSRKERDVILSSLAMSVLEMFPKTSRYVFQNPRGGNRPVGKSTLGQWFVAARQASGIKGPKGAEVWLHTMRKSFATISAMKGANIYMLMQHLGHSSKEVHDKYVRMSPEYYQAFRTFLDGGENPEQPAPKPGPSAWDRFLKR